MEGTSQGRSGAERASWRVVVALAAGLGMGLSCGDGAGGGVDPCVPGSQIMCLCVGGGSGIQTCLPDGTYAMCVCDGVTGTSSPSGGDTQTDSGTDGTAGSSSASAGTDQALCGNGSIDAGECDMQDAAYCPADCPPETTTDSQGTTTGSGCPIFAALVDAQPANWIDGVNTGLDAGNSLCVTSGGDHVCDYEELVMAEVAGQLDGLPVGVSAWVHRTTAAEVDGDLSPAGTGGRCVNWTSAVDDYADGEYFDVTNEGVVFHLDPDTFYDGVDTTHADPTDFPCAAITRAIPCCDPCP